MAFPKKFKPETVARHAKEWRENRIKRRNQLIADLTAKANEEGPNSIWAEMLAEQIARNALEDAA